MSCTKYCSLPAKILWTAAAKPQHPASCQQFPLLLSLAQSPCGLHESIIHTLVQASPFIVHHLNLVTFLTR